MNLNGGKKDGHCPLPWKALSFQDQFRFFLRHIFTLAQAFDREIGPSEHPFDVEKYFCGL
jgi:hypothetical protein